MKKIPKSLRTWFIIHFFIDYLFGIPLIIAPYWTLTLFGWQVIEPFSARLVGAALLGIGGISLLNNKSSLESYNDLLTLKIIWSSAALIGIFISMSEGTPIFGWAVFMLFGIFLFVWIYYKICLRNK